SSWSTCHKILHILMFITSFGEQNITYKCCSNFLIHLSNIWRKAGLDTAKINLIREVVDKALWNQPEAMAQQIKALQIKLEGFRPIEEAISCAGGIKQKALTENLSLKQISGVFCCGEMLDWDAPTGGYLLTACFATGRAAGEGVHSFLEK
ncbi:NAD(P)/FAD-dependent oxidoreductase, partial [Acinetobacter pittii]|uniref:NAD(P)/FAD-dependent oxidoreductase n=1 Tax=Acinetobacter pittii TaxID=48296 RepID=UPI0032B4B57C